MPKTRQEELRLLFDYSRDHFVTKSMYASDAELVFDNDEDTEPLVKDLLSWRSAHAVPLVVSFLMDAARDAWIKACPVEPFFDVPIDHPDYAIRTQTYRNIRVEAIDNGDSGDASFLENMQACDAMAFARHVVVEKLKEIVEDHRW